MSGTYRTHGGGEKLIQKVGWETERQNPLRSRPTCQKCGIILKWIVTRVDNVNRIQKF